MKFKDYYQILGVARGASQDEIKRAYRRLARKYHPDVSREADAEERFKELSEAYEVLRDPEKRAAYDRLGPGWRAGEDFSPPPDWSGADFHFRRGGFSTEDTRQFSDFFEALFGGGMPFGDRGFRVDETVFQAPPRPQAAELTIDLEEAYRGATRQVTMETPVPDAHGRVRRQARSFNVKIPAGVTDGQRIRLAGQTAGAADRTAGGDVYLDVRIRPHPLFRLEGRDVYLDLPLAPWEAALGTRVTAPTLGAEVELRIPPGTQGGGKLRLKGRGLPGSPPGDQYLVARIVTPPATDDARKRLYERMAAEMAFDPRAGWKDVHRA